MIEVLFGESEAASMKAAKCTVISGVTSGSTSIFFAGKKKPLPQNESARWIEGTANEVVCLDFKLDIGQINQEIDGEYRKKLIDSMLHQGPWSQDPGLDEELVGALEVYVQELARFRQFLDDGEDIRIWYSRSAYSLCGLYYVCSIIKGCQKSRKRLRRYKCQRRNNGANCI